MEVNIANGITPEDIEKWEHAIKVFKEGMNQVDFKMYIEPMKLVAITTDKLYISMPDGFALDQIKGRKLGFYEPMFRANFGMQYRVAMVSESEAEELVKKLHPETIKPEFTFDSFVVGKSNEFAYAAAQAVAQAPSETYNPLFIYGDVGLGKTHLMNAIGNYIADKDPKKNIFMTTADAYRSELISLIATKKGTGEMRRKMRAVDVLMIDDIQFISNSPQTQEEFFHTFNDLHNANKQIIISSDRPPMELKTIADRLRSRFAMGLIVDIQKPDFETRVAILQQKALRDRLIVPDDVEQYIAMRFTDSIRALEGALNRVAARAKIMRMPIDLEIATNTLDTLGAQEEAVITPKKIISAVAAEYGVTFDDIMSKKRTKDVAAARQGAMWLCKKMLNLTTTSIGKEFGGKDHSTVVHAIDVIDDQIGSDFDFKMKMKILEDKARSGE